MDIRALYSFALDGGTGTIILRGASLSGLICFHLRPVEAVILAPFAATPGTTLDFGWAANPTGLAGGIDPQYFTVAPELDPLTAPAPPSLYFGPRTPIQMTVNGVALVSGELELVIEAFRP